EGLIADQPILDDLREPSRQLSRRQRAQRRDVDQHCLRLVEGADHVLAQRMVDASLATYRRIDLRKQRRWHLYEIYTALITGDGITGHVSHDTAAQGNNSGMPIMAG